jgi:ABC-type polysaccharide/polyol phosphate transport system ATPase subunit
MSRAVVEARGLGKAFFRHPDRPLDLKVQLLGFLHGRLRKPSAPFWAVKNVDLAVAEGECLGIVGPNGSGKSTLLRLLAAVLNPSAGSVRVQGRVAPLMELGVGFHGDLTGRENVFLTTSLFGLSWRETRAVYGAIVSFAELGDFMDLPVKTYSTGMAMRLGFSIAIHLEAEVFLVDEVLSVGDAEFQEKCLARIEALRAEGKTIVCVSHDLELVARMCHRALLLQGGEIRLDGPPGDVLDAYRRLLSPAP